MASLTSDATFCRVVGGRPVALSAGRSPPLTRVLAPRGSRQTTVKPVEIGVIDSMRAEPRGRSSVPVVNEFENALHGSGQRSVALWIVALQLGAVRR